MLKFRSAVAALGVLGVLAMTGSAFAAPTTVSATVGPVGVPNVAVSVCVNANCTSTPVATTVALTVSVTVNPDAVVLPTVTAGTCSNGQGVALVVTTGSIGTIISGSVSVTVNGTPTVIPVPQTPAPANQTVIVGACVSPGIGVPAVPAVPGLPV